ncbi:hypothetical protein U3516DRAFT_739060 [Neocallimastix sp. 'constans']
MINCNAGTESALSIHHKQRNSYRSTLRDPQLKAEPTIEELETVNSLRQGLRNGIIKVGKNRKNMILMGFDPETFC